MAAANELFSVDVKGLAKLIEEQGAARLIAELVRNSLDEDGVTEVNIHITPEPNRPLCCVSVEDDAPGGFADLAHSYTLFAESYKKTHAEKAGRFNLGDKLFIAASILTGETTRILSTNGGVEFSLKGGRVGKKNRRPKGSLVGGYLRITRDQLNNDVIPFVKSILLPQEVSVSLNGERLPARKPIKTFKVTLPTVLADDEGVLRTRHRETVIELHKPLPGERVGLYELGMPVVDLDGGEKWHVNVLQKIPLNFNRDNVTPKYLQFIRTLVLNETHDALSPDEASNPWVRDAAADDRAVPEAINTVLTHRFGEKRVAHDPSDMEANLNAAAAGFTVIQGRSLSKEEWENVRAKAPVQSAGSAFPTRHAFEGGPGSPVAEFLEGDELTDGMHRIIKFSGWLHWQLFNRGVEVRILKPSPTNEMHWCACYGQTPARLTFHLKKLGHAFFDEMSPTNFQRQLELIVHEFGHQAELNHLSDKYHEALCNIAAKMALITLYRRDEFLEAMS